MQWYEINLSADTADIMIFEKIGKDPYSGQGVSAKKFLEDLRLIRANNIKLEINSPGGYVFEGYSIYNGLRAHQARKHVKITGIAASVASVIAMAGDTVEMPENSMLMIHNPWGLIVGGAADMRKYATALDKMKVGAVSSYRTKTGLTDTKISTMMDDETWLTATEAKELGFADQITEAVEAQACFDMLSQYRNVPTSLLNGDDMMNNPLYGSTGTMKIGQRKPQQHTPNEAAARAKWDNDPNLRAEFVEFESYLAFVTPMPGVRVKTTRGVGGGQ